MERSAAVRVKASEKRGGGRAVKPAAMLAPLGAALAGAFVFHGALFYFFTQDDFAALARAAGLIPRFTEPWRFLSLQLYFDAMRPLAGLAPLPYHIVSLAGHAAAAWLVFRLLRHVLGAPGAFGGAVFFACHPASFTAIYWISTVGDVYAVVFGIAALLIALRPERRRWLAVAAFALALLSKESVLLMPLALPLMARDRRVLRDPVFLSMIGLSLIFLAYLYTQGELGDPTQQTAQAPYAAALGGHVVPNLLTYLGWTANFLLPTVQGFTDSIDPPVHPYGGALALIAVAGLFVPALRRRGWVEGLALYVLLLLPILPLRNHTYHYYLYAPLVGAALWVGALLDLTVARLDGGRWRWAVAGVLAIGLVASGRALVRKIEVYPFLLPGTRSEPLIDRALIARNVLHGLEGAELPSGTTLRLLSPEAMALAAANAPGTFGPGAETYWERNVRSALYQGLAVRLFQPSVERVEFVREISEEINGNVRYALYRVTGETTVPGPGTLDSLRSTLSK